MLQGNFSRPSHPWQSEQSDYPIDALQRVPARSLAVAVNRLKDIDERVADTFAFAAHISDQLVGARPDLGQAASSPQGVGPDPLVDAIFETVVSLDAKLDLLRNRLDRINTGLFG